MPVALTGLDYVRVDPRKLPVAMHDGAVLLVTDDGLLAVDIKTGRPRWKFSMECTNIYGLVVRDDVAYFMNTGWPVPAIDHRLNLRPRAPRYLYALDLTKACQLDVPPEYEHDETVTK